MSAIQPPSLSPPPSQPAARRRHPAIGQLDKKIAAAGTDVALAEAVKTERALALRSMKAGIDTAHSRLTRMDRRKSLYEERLLVEIHDQAEASLTAYTNDDGDFPKRCGPEPG